MAVQTRRQKKILPARAIKKFCPRKRKIKTTRRKALGKAQPPRKAPAKTNIRKIKKDKIKTKKKKCASAAKNDFYFNARGDNAPSFETCVKSADPDFCDIPHHVMQDLGRLLNVSYEMRDMIDDNDDLSYCEIINKLLPQKCLGGWRVSTYLGSGVAGYVFGSHNSKNKKTGALKIQVPGRNHTIKQEVSNHKKFASMGLSPEVHSYCSRQKFGGTIAFLNMARIDIVVRKWLRTTRSKMVIDQFVEKLFDMIAVMGKQGFTHGDLHSENIGFVYKRTGVPGKIQILDHGYAHTKGSMPLLEIVQFMRSITTRYAPRSHAPTTKYLTKRCIEEAWNIYGFKIRKGINHLEGEFCRLRGKLRRMKNA